MAKTDEYEPELVVREGQAPFYLSDDSYGNMVAWSTCHPQSGGCGQHIMACNCKKGPSEPYFITRWRVEAHGGVFQRTKSKPASERAFRTPNVKTRPSNFSETRSGGLAVSDFIDADVIAKVKAASETAVEDR